MVRSSLCLLDEFLFFNPAFLTGKVAEVKQPGTANFTEFNNFNFSNVRRSIREDTFNPYSIGYFTYRKGLGSSFATNLNHIASEFLDTLFVSFNNLLADDDVIS